MQRIHSTSLPLGALLIAGMLFGAPLVAQGDSPLLAVNAMGSGSPCDDVADAIEECLLETGLKTGWNERTKTFCVYATMEMLPKQSVKGGFASRRAKTFELVLGDASGQLATFLGAEVARQVRAYYLEGSKLDLSIPGIARAKDLLQQAAKAAATTKELCVSETFSKAVSVIAMQEAGAMQCYQCYEAITEGGGAGTVGAIFILNRTSQSMQAAMLGKGAASKRSPGVSSMERAMTSYKDGRLAATHGVLFHVDEGGEVCLLSVAHTPVRGRRARGALEGARAEALGYLRSFAGERVFLSALNTDDYSLQEYADLSLTFSSTERREAYVKRISDDLSTQGAVQVYQRVHRHAASGERMQTVVMEWKLTSANVANLLASRAQVMKGATGGKGTDGLFPPRRR